MKINNAELFSRKGVRKHLLTTGLVLRPLLPVNFWRRHADKLSNWTSLTPASTIRAPETVSDASKTRYTENKRKYAVRKG